MEDQYLSRLKRVGESLQIGISMLNIGHFNNKGKCTYYNFYKNPSLSSMIKVFTITTNLKGKKLSANICEYIEAPNNYDSSLSL